MDNHVPEKIPPPIKAIKSYLYKKPPAALKKNITPEPMTETKIEVIEPKSTEKNEIKKVLSTQDVRIKVEKNIEPITLPLQRKDNKQSFNEAIAKPDFSALAQLNKLQSSINRESIQQGLQQYQQHRSVSVMHGEPIPVQHSSKQLSYEEKKTTNTTVLSDNVAIVKGDDGRCLIERDLSNVGMEGVTSVSSFACGSSKFDKSFRAHMKKIKEKLGK
ncbi:MAG: uncharacterized membrane protein YheB (UPF0754 family) [Alteromonadaceae bacterium]|jgi:uncharacterized membrane protein YheB (UPF0754 family)